MSIPSPIPSPAFREHLWQNHQRLARRVVAEYCMREDLKEEASQEVQLALWEASNAWSEQLKDTFTHYAWLVMRRKLLFFLTQKASDRPRLSRREQEVMNALRRNLEAGQLISCKTIDELSQESGISRFRLTQLVSFWYASHLSLTATSMIQLEELASDEDREQNEKALLLLEISIKELPEREQEIIIQRFLSDPKKTLADLSSVLGVSIERVRQLEANALRKLKKSLEKFKAE